MSASIYLLTLCLTLATILLVFGIRAVASVQQAKARLANDGAYRELAERAAELQSDTATSLSALHAAMVEVGSRLGSVEKILKDVG